MSTEFQRTPTTGCQAYINDADQISLRSLEDVRGEGIISLSYEDAYHLARWLLERAEQQHPLGASRD